MKRFVFHALLVCNMCFLPVMAQQSDDKLATFFVGRVKYSKNDGNDCSGVGKDLIQLVSRASTIQVQEEDLCCSFAMANNCNAGRGIEPNEGKKIALNIAVYSLTH